MSYCKSLLILLILFLQFNCREEYETVAARGESGKFGVLREGAEKDKWKVAPTYDKLLGTQAENYFLAKQNGKWGIIDAKGRIRADFVYDTIWLNYNSDKCVLKGRDGLKVALLENNFRITAHSYDSVWFSVYDHMSYAPVFTKVNGKYGIVGYKGNDLITGCDSIVWEPYDCHQQIILFMQNRKCGVMKTTGRVIVQSLYDSIGFWPDVDCRRMTLQLNASMHYINHRGKEMKPVIDSISEGDFIRGNHPEISIGKRH